MASPSSRDTLLRRVLIEAATTPVSLFLGMGGLLLALNPATGVLGWGALAADAVWVWLRSRDPALARRSSEALLHEQWLELVGRLEALSAELDRETAAVLEAIVEAQERLISGTAPVPGTRAELTSLLRHCVSLVEKRRQLQGYLAGIHLGELERQSAELGRRRDAAPDAVTRQLYVEAVAHKTEELANYREVEAAIARIDGQLAAVHCSFDNLLSRMVRVRTTASLEAEGLSETLFSELNRLTQGVAALESSLAETLTLRGAA